MAAVVLYKWPKQGNLPSLTVPSLIAETYLRMSEVEFYAEQCTSVAKSPTGQLPAVEKGSEVGGTPSVNDFDASRAVLAFLRKHGVDLDTALPAAQQAEVLAFTALMESRLEPATNLGVWAEWAGFLAFRKVAYAQLPFPLSWVVPWSRRNQMTQRLAGLDPQQVYADAVAALQALSDRLRGGDGQYLVGGRHSSADALLFAHAAFYRFSPAAPPALKKKVEQLPVLLHYLDAHLLSLFSMEAPPASEAPSSSDTWSRAAQGLPRQEPRELTETEKTQRRNSAWWLGGVGAAITAYVVMGGHYIQFVAADEEDYDDDDEDGEGGPGVDEPDVDADGHDAR